MIVAYQQVHRIERDDRQPEVFVGRGMGFLLSLKTSDFEIKHVDGRAEVHLSRNLTTAEALALGQALVAAALAPRTQPVLAEIMEQ